MFRIRIPELTGKNKYCYWHQLILSSIINFFLFFFFFWQKIVQDEKSRKRILLSSVHSLHVESVYETDVKVAIKQLSSSWKIASKNPCVREPNSPCNLVKCLPPHFDVKRKKENSNNY